jgi:hypothetical protein
MLHVNPTGNQAVLDGDGIARLAVMPVAATDEGPMVS